MTSVRAIAIAVAVAVAAGAVAVLAWGPWSFVERGVATGGVQATVVVTEALGGGDVAGFSRVTAPRRFEFPADLGPHPEFRTEWWYYTGNLQTAAGRHAGFQLTFFRTALAPPPDSRGLPQDRAATPRGAGDRAASRRESAWATTQLYLAHFAVTDTEGRRFHAWSRTSREALGLAGARAEPFRVWLDDWSAASESASGTPVRLRAAEGDVAIDLVLGSDKPVVAQGDRGLSRKGPEPGNASYYYSLTRMPARGTVRLGGNAFDVSGLAWMDREWSTSALGPDLAGWDWLALQLDDGRDIMVYRLRRRDGTSDPYSAGTIVAADGSVQPLGPEGATLDVLDHWTSPKSLVRYPSRWRLTVPAAALRLDIVPRLPEQELITGTRYWEGAVRVEGSAAGRPVSGRGYVELVGYGE